LPAGGGTNLLKPDKPAGPANPAFSSRKGGDFTAIGQGPSHSLKQTNVQLLGVTHPAANAAPAMNGFIASFRTSLQNDLKRAPIESELQQAMNGFTPEQLPVLATLARNYVLCDHWFADVPGPTMPNRAFVHAATSQGYTYNANWKPEFTCKTLYDRINADPKRSWRVYRHDHDDVLQLYPYLKKDATNHVSFASTFVSDVAGDRLPTYSFIDPAFLNVPQLPANSMHAPADVRPAEKLVADVYGALQANEAVWKKTLLIILCDEHGGYYDHVPPPQTVSPDNIAGRTDQSFLVPFDFKRLGLRVPAILVSPWFPPKVDSTIYSHASIPGTIIDALSLPGGFLTKRDKKAKKFTHYLVDDGKRVWRNNIPNLNVPVQPQSLDEMQRTLLAATVQLDPHPEQRNPLRTQDIQDPAQARDFMRTQIAKHLEHYFASGGQPAVAATLSGGDVPPSTSPSPARISQMEQGRPHRRRRNRAQLGL
jgi:phospholipase C